MSCHLIKCGKASKQHLINCILMHAKVVIVSDGIRNNSATICSRAQNRVQVDDHRRERARKPRKPLRFEEEPYSWTVHVAVRDSIERELILPPCAT